MMTLSLVPNSAEAYSNHGNMLKESGRLDEAVESYRQAIALKPDFAEAYGDLGNVYKEQGKLDKAIASYQQALALNPDYAKACVNLGVVLHEGGLLDEAAAHYRRALAIQSDYVAAHFNLGALYMSLGQTEDALRSFRMALNFKPDLASAAHMIAVLEGKTTQSAPPDYIKNLFNHYAGNFENHLLNKLEYKIPHILFQYFTLLLPSQEGISALSAAEPSRTRIRGSGHGPDAEGRDSTPASLVADAGRRIRHAIDLGCGTGLAGELFVELTDRLTGVDLSDKMLEIAHKKGVYNDLHQSEIVAFLHETKDCYDLFLATDVFIYVGGLEEVFSLIKDRSLPGAYFAFSTEWMDGTGFALQDSARYAHSRDYIDSLCKLFGFRIAHCEGVTLRKDKEAWIPGDIFIVQLATDRQDS